MIAVTTHGNAVIQQKVEVDMHDMIGRCLGYLHAEADPYCTSL